MRLSAPKKNTFFASLIIVVVGLLAQYDVISALSDFAYLITLLGFVVLAAGVYLKGF